MNDILTRRSHCRICDSKSLIPVMSLKKTPLANAFLRKDQLNESEEKFPLDLFFCETCAHLQLLDVVNPEVLFRNYLYVSSTSLSFIEHFRLYAEDLIRRYQILSGSLVVEIGSNDGILLKHFKAKKMRVLGVDPALNIARSATKIGIETLSEFFSVKVAESIRKEHGQAAIIAANNVFAHADDLHEILEGVKQLLLPNGIFVFEISYLLDVYEKTLFDTIYHEHLSYHSVKPLQLLFHNHGMELIEAIRVPSHGGSLRGIVQLIEGPYPKEVSVEQLIQREEALGLYKAETFVQFAQKINALKESLRKLLDELKAQGKKIAGFGAPAKMTTLMHHFEIDPRALEFIVDDSPLKQNLYTPGYHLPVVPATSIYESNIDYVLILAWNFAENIIKQHGSFLEKGGHFIIPLPQLEIK